MKTINHILLIQPRHIYAPELKDAAIGHIYLPTSLISVAAFLSALSIEIDFKDENIEPVIDYSNNVGINLLGAPYIPKVRYYENLLTERFGNNYSLFIGGQIVNGLSSYDFSRLFSSNVINGNNFKDLISKFDTTKSVPDITELSHIPAYKLIPQEFMSLYLRNELGFYLSQGCKHSCSFCSASRSKIRKGNVVQAKEKYRNIDVAIIDLKYLILQAKNRGIGELNIYLSNLDLFQTPAKLREFAQKVVLLKRELDFKLSFRGLSNVSSFLLTHEKYPEILIAMQEAGLNRIGFGIDGATPQVYKLTRKPQNIQMCLDAIRISKEIYNITPETLMVFGHNNKEDENSLEQAVTFCKDMFEKYGAYPRPHVAKDIVPGNDGWDEESNFAIREKFYNSIGLFQNLDFTALPSSITHPNKHFRSIVTKYFTEICALPNSLTQYVYPENDTLSQPEIAKIKEFNKGKYDL